MLRRTSTATFTCRRSWDRKAAKSPLPALSGLSCRAYSPDSSTNRMIRSSKDALPCSNRRKSKAYRSKPAGSMMAYGLISANCKQTRVLWAGLGQQAAPLLYAIANHAGMLNWWEEQKLQDKGPGVAGDMPNNWGSVEFLRQMRFMLALERGGELHLFEGLPAEWTRPGMVVQLNQILTDFGPLSLTLGVSADGKTATLNLDVPQRVLPAKVMLHLDGWSGRTGVIELPPEAGIERKIEMNSLLP